MTEPGWVVVIPVKGTPAAKSRLGGDDVRRGALAMAIALDTVESAISAPGVSRVVVVTSTAAGDQFSAIGASVVLDDDEAGLNAAVMLGVRSAADGESVAILLGDLPALQPGELGAALLSAREHPLSMVPDADGTGTVLLTALAGERHDPAFGEGSRLAHLSRGYFEINARAGLRRDVDTIDQLRAIPTEDLGRRTARLL